jgi:hypothetical protein
MSSSYYTTVQIFETFNVHVINLTSFLTEQEAAKVILDIRCGAIDIGHPWKPPGVLH